MEPTPETRRFVAKNAIDIWAFTASDVIRGTAHRLASQRLSDVVNDVLTPTLKGPRSRFLPVTHAAVQPIAGGTSSAQPFLAVSKAHLLFLGELGPGSHAGDTPQAGGWITVSLIVAGQTVEGRIFRPAGKRLLDVLNDDREFLPVTQATIRWLSGVARRFDFVSVAKYHIIQSIEADIS